MSSPFRSVLASLARGRGVTACLVVDARDGVIIDSTLPFGMRGNVVAALVASLVRKASRSADAAGVGVVSFIQLEAERGRVCAVEHAGVLLVVVADLRANVALLRMDLLAAREALAL